MKTKQGDEEVVRGVELVLHLSNGNSEVHASSATVEVLPPEELPDLTEEG